MDTGGQQFRQARTLDKRQQCLEQRVTALKHLAWDKKKLRQVIVKPTAANWSALQGFTRIIPKHLKPPVVHGLFKTTSKYVSTTKNKMSPPKINTSHTCCFPYKGCDPDQSYDSDSSSDSNSDSNSESKPSSSSSWDFNLGARAAWTFLPARLPRVLDLCFLLFRGELEAWLRSEEVLSRGLVGG